MIPEQLNPYESPTPVEQDREHESDDSVKRRYDIFLSNRFMSFVIGIPGSLFLLAGTPYLIIGIAMQLTPNAISGNLHTIALSIGLAGVLIGGAMLATSIFLWRYDAKA